MEAIIQQLAVEHAREAALLWSLHNEDPDEELVARIKRHIAGMQACQRRGADPLAGFDRPLSGAELLPAACLGASSATDADDLGRLAIAAAASISGCAAC